MPWTDWAGRRHETMRGRPVVDACDARHLGAFQRLPDLPRAASAADAARHDRCAGRLALQVAASEALPAGPEAGRQARQVEAGKPLAGRPLGYPMAPEDLILDADGSPARIDKAFSWEAPIAAHGMMHMLITQRLEGRPLQDRHAVHVHGQHGVELGDEHRRDDAHADRQGPGDRRATRSRASSIPTRIYSETVAYADLILPDTTYLERWDCISLLDRPIGEVDGPADSIRQPVLDARPRRAPVPGRADRAGRPARPAGFRRRRRRAALSRRLQGLHRQSRARARASGRSPAGAAPTASQPASGAPNPRPARALHRQWLLLEIRAAARSSSTTSTPTRPISKTRWRWASSATPSRSCCSFMSSRCRTSASPRRATARSQPPEQHRGADRDLFRPAAVLVSAVRGGARSTARPSRCTRSPSGRCRCTIPGIRRMPGCARSSAHNRLFMNRVTARGLGPRRRRLGLGDEPCTAASGPSSS